MNYYEKIMELANSSKDYDEFREQAMDITPDHLKESFGSHMLEWYIDFRYPDQSRPEEKE